MNSVNLFSGYYLFGVEKVLRVIILVFCYFPAIFVFKYLNGLHFEILY